MRSILNLIRVRQWVKNLFVLAPLFFAGHWMVPGKLFLAAISTWAFCCVASGVYIINDYLDHNKDKLHPIKKNRPLSTNQISIKIAFKLAFIFIMLGLACGCLAGLAVVVILLMYLTLHLIYNGWARNIALVDILFISLGFQLRILAGALAVSVAPSVWLMICVLVLSLFLGFVKRRCEMIILKEKALRHRSALLGYSYLPLDLLILLFSIFTIMAYGFYTVSPEVVLRCGSWQMALSSVFVLFGVLRYLFLVYFKNVGDDPAEVLSKDFWSVINAAGWLIYIWMVLYLKI